MSNGTGFCANCGGERGIHHYQTDQCPVGGVEAPVSRKQEYKTSTFVDIPFDPPVRLAKDLTVREHFAAMALQGIISTQTYENGFVDSYKTILDEDGKVQYDVEGEPIRELVISAEQKCANQAVQYADTLIEALKQP